jgi:hypothetical protein
MNKLKLVILCSFLMTGFSAVSAPIYPGQVGDVLQAQDQTIQEKLTHPDVIAVEAITRYQLLELTNVQGPCSPGEYDAYVMDNQGIVVMPLCWTADAVEPAITLSDGHRQALEYFKWTKTGYLYLGKVYAKQVSDYKRVNGIK